MGLILNYYMAIYKHTLNQGSATGGPKGKGIKLWWRLLKFCTLLIALNESKNIELTVLNWSGVES